jgi:LPS-assembly protein
MLSMKSLVAKICQVSILLALSATLSTAAGEPEAGSVNVKADTISYDKEMDLMQARGNVEIRWDQFTLLSDSALVRQGENEAIAEGKVNLLKGDDILKSDRLRLNYQTEQGEADNGDLFIKQRNFHMRGARFIKTGKEEYRLERGSFTTCDGEKPSWKFTASNLELAVNDYAKGTNAVFYVGDFPVFYTPYILFPVKSERQSGFLFSRVGSSTIKGFYLDLPYYWSITPSQDITVDLDSQTKRGEGLGIDYRYIRSRDSDGEFQGYLIYDIQQQKARGYLTQKGHEALSPDLILTSDISLTLDRNYFRDYGESSGDYNRQILDSELFLTKNRGLNSFTAEVRYVDNLDAPNNRATMQKIPALTFTRARSPIGKTPFYVGLDSSFVEFYRNDGIRGQRLDLHPTLAFYHALPQGVNYSAWVGYHQRFYNASDGVDAGNGYHDDGLFDAGTKLATSLTKVYSVDNGGLKSISHTLIPELSYSFIQEKNQDRLPFFDYDDRLLGQQMVTWSLSNYVTGKYIDQAGPVLYRDLLYLKLSQRYQAGGSRHDPLAPRDLLTLVDEGRRFTDMRIEARLSPIKMFSITTDSRYDPYQTRFSTASFGLDLNDGSGNMAAFSYRFSRGQVEYLETKSALSLVKPFVFNYNCRYSFDKGGFLESVYSVEYKRQCWSVIFSYRDRPNDKGFVVSFTLAGVGALGPMKAF